jgi:hypothetical protein
MSVMWYNATFKTDDLLEIYLLRCKDHFVRIADVSLKFFFIHFVILISRFHRRKRDKNTLSPIVN